MVKEEEECNIDESSTGDIKQETYKEEDKNELQEIHDSISFPLYIQKRSGVWFSAER